MYRMIATASGIFTGNNDRSPLAADHRLSDTPHRVQSVPATTSNIVRLARRLVRRKDDVIVTVIAALLVLLFLLQLVWVIVHRSHP